MAGRLRGRLGHLAPVPRLAVVVEDDVLVELAE
jgi:hypothetical protein